MKIVGNIGLLKHAFVFLSFCILSIANLFSMDNVVTSELTSTGSEQHLELYENIRLDQKEITDSELSSTIKHSAGSKRKSLIDNQPPDSSISSTVDNLPAIEVGQDASSREIFTIVDNQKNTPLLSKLKWIKKIFRDGRTRKLGVLLLSSVLISNVDHLAQHYLNLKNKEEKALCSAIGVQLTRSPPRCTSESVIPEDQTCINAIVSASALSFPLFINVDSLQIILQLLFGEGLRQYAGHSFDSFNFLLPGIAFKLLDFAFVAYNINFSTGVANSFLYASFSSLFDRFKNSRKNKYERQMDYKLDELKKQLDQF